jgi:hypothetical protein
MEHQAATDTVAVAVPTLVVTGHQLDLMVAVAEPTETLDKQTQVLGARVFTAVQQVLAVQASA